MEKMLGQSRSNGNNDISEVITELRMLSSAIENDPVIQRSANIVNEMQDLPRSSSYRDFRNCSENTQESLFSSFNISKTPEGHTFPDTRYRSPDFAVVAQARNLMESFQENPSCSTQYTNKDSDLQITETIPANKTASISHGYSNSDIAKNVNIKREVAEKVLKKSSAYVKFTMDEDKYLYQGIQKYGKKSWAMILKDKEYDFHNSRTRDSLRVRADSAGFKKSLGCIKL